MPQNPYRLFSLLFVLLIGILSLDLLSLTKNKPTETDVNLAQITTSAGEVLTGSDPPSYYYKFYLKDAASVNKTNTGGESSNYLSGATVAITNKASFHCGDDGANYIFADYYGLYKIICQESTTMNLKISKSGYNTKYTSLTAYQGTIPTVTLTLYVPPPPTPPPPPPETIKDVSLPQEFKEVGTASTDLSKIADPAKVESLTLDTKNNTIKFKEVVDLSSTDTKDKFKILTAYVNAETKGVIGLDSAALPALNKKATLTMKDLSFTKKPKVLVDGKQDNSVVSNVKYEKGILTFDAAHFSTFTAAPEITITEPKRAFETTDPILTLKGIVSDKLASVSAKVNGKAAGDLKVATTSGEFEGSLTLKKGSNSIVVNALSANGATASASVSANLVKAIWNQSWVLILLGIIALIAAASAAYTWWKWKKGKKNGSMLKTEPKDPTATS